MDQCGGIARLLVSPWHGRFLPTLPAAPTDWRIAPARALRSFPACAVPARRNQCEAEPSQGEAGQNASCSRRQGSPLGWGIKTSMGSRTASETSALRRMQLAGGPGPVRSIWRHQAAGLSSPAALLPAVRQSGLRGAAPQPPLRPGRPARLPSRCADSSPLSFRAALAPSRRDRAGRKSAAAGSCIQPSAALGTSSRSAEASSSRIVACMAREHRRPLIASLPAATPGRSDRDVDSRSLATESLPETGSLTAALVRDLRGRQSAP